MPNLLTIHNSEFYGINEDGTCRSCGYPSSAYSESGMCLCDRIIQLEDHMINAPTLGEQSDIADRIHFLISMRNLDTARLRQRLEATKNPELQQEWAEHWGFGGPPAQYIEHPTTEPF